MMRQGLGRVGGVGLVISRRIDPANESRGSRFLGSLAPLMPRPFFHIAYLNSWNGMDNHVGDMYIRYDVSLVTLSFFFRCGLIPMTHTT